MIELYQEKHSVTVTMADGTEDTSPVVHHGARIIYEGKILAELPAAENYGLTEDKVRRQAEKMAAELGLGRLSPAEALAEIEAKIEHVNARADAEIARLQILRAAAMKR